MDQEATCVQNLQQDLLTLGVGESVVYGHINKFGSSIIHGAVFGLVRRLEDEHKVMRFQRKTSFRHEFELVAVGITPSINEKIRAGIERYEIKVGLSSRGLPIKR